MILIDHLVQLSPSGHTLSMIGTNTLADSCSTLLDTFHSLVSIFGVPIGKAMVMLSENPARYLKPIHLLLSRSRPKYRIVKKYWDNNNNNNKTFMKVSGRI